MDRLRQRRNERKQKSRPTGCLARAWHAVVNFFFYCIVNSTAVDDDQVPDEAEQYVPSHQASQASLKSQNSSLHNVLFHNTSSHEPRHFNCKDRQPSVDASPSKVSLKSQLSTQSKSSSKKSEKSWLFPWNKKSNQVTPVESLASLGGTSLTSIVIDKSRGKETHSPRDTADLYVPNRFDVVEAEVQTHSSRATADRDVPNRFDVVEGGTIPDVYSLIKRTLSWGIRPDATTKHEDKNETPQTLSRTSEQKEKQGPKDKPMLPRSASMPVIKLENQNINTELKRSVSLPSLKLDSLSSKDPHQKTDENNKDEKAKPIKTSHKLRGLFSKKKHLQKSSGVSVKADTSDVKKKFFKSISLPSLRLNGLFSKKDSLQKDSGESVKLDSKNNKDKFFRSFSLPSLKLSSLFSRKDSLKKISYESAQAFSQDNDSDIPDSKSPSLHKLHTEWDESIINLEVLLGLKKPKNSREALAVEKELGSGKPYWMLDDESNNSTVSRDSVISRDEETSSDAEGMSGVETHDSEESRDAQGPRDNKSNVDDVDLDSGVASREVSSQDDQSLLSLIFAIKQ